MVNNNNDTGVSFINIQSMLILLLLFIVIIIILCLLGCIIFGRHPNTLFTYKSHHSSTSSSDIYNDDDDDDATELQNTTSSQLSNIASINLHQNSTVMNSTITKTTTLTTTMIESYSHHYPKCFGMIHIYVPTSTVDTMTTTMIQAVFDKGKEIILLSSSSSSSSSNTSQSGENNYIDENKAVGVHHHHPQLDGILPPNQCDHIQNHHNNCSICLMDYINNDSIYRNYPHCDHIFHTNCILQWVTSSSNNNNNNNSSNNTTRISSAECPCCRRPINPLVVLSRPDHEPHTHETNDVG